MQSLTIVDSRAVAGVEELLPGCTVVFASSFNSLNSLTLQKQLSSSRQVPQLQSLLCILVMGTGSIHADQLGWVELC